MKSVVIFSVLLLSAATVQSMNQNFGVTKCCFKFADASSFIQNVVDYQETHPLCPRKGIILTTKTKKQVCVDPQQEMIKRLTKDLAATRG
ncbi:C-C motif chemokine 3-like [Synchiropus picturatus]